MQFSISKHRNIYNVERKKKTLSSIILFSQSNILYSGPVWEIEHKYWPKNTYLDIHMIQYYYGIKAVNY